MARPTGLFGPTRAPSLGRTAQDWTYAPSLADPRPESGPTALVDVCPHTGAHGPRASASPTAQNGPSVEYTHRSRPRLAAAVFRFLFQHCNNYFVPVERPKPHVVQLYYRSVSCEQLRDYQGRTFSDMRDLFKLFDADMLLEKEYPQGRRTSRDTVFT